MSALTAYSSCDHQELTELFKRGYGSSSIQSLHWIHFDLSVGWYVCYVLTGKMKSLSVKAQFVALNLE